MRRSLESDTEACSAAVRAIVNGSVDVWGSPGERQDVCWAQVVPLHAHTGSVALQQTMESLLGRGASTGYSPATAASVAASRYFSYSDAAAANPSGASTAGSNHVKSSGGGARQAAGGRGVVILDDLHLPAADKYGTHAHAELLRSHISFGGWARSTEAGVAFKRVSGLGIVATCSTTAVGGASPNGSALVARRLLPYFFPIGLPQPTKPAMEAVLTSRVVGHLSTW